MKNQIPALLLIGMITLFCNAQNNVMYLMKDGYVLAKFDVNNDIDSIIFYQPKKVNNNTFTDSRDGNIYKYVTIGTQTWMTENLRYLPDVVSPDIFSLTEPYYYVNGYEGTNVTAAKATANYLLYGVLYNWSAAMGSDESSFNVPSGIQGACPNGWHLPSDAEWSVLTDFLGGADVAGGKLKEEGTDHWFRPNTGATNETFFTALPGGVRRGDSYAGPPTGSFASTTLTGYFWSSTEVEVTFDLAYLRKLSSGSTIAYSSHDLKTSGASVRCVKDN